MTWDGSELTVSGNTTVANFMLQLRRELEESSAVVWATASLLSWTNEGLADFAKRTKILSAWATGNTVAAQANYSLAANTYQVDRFVYSATPLARIDENAYYDKYLAASGTGTPSYYSVIGDVAYLYPTPASVKAYRYHRYYKPTAYTSATTTTSLPFSPDHDQTIRNYAKARAYEQIRDFDTSGVHQGLYDSEVMRVSTENIYNELGDSVLMPSTAW